MKIKILLLIGICALLPNSYVKGQGSNAQNVRTEQVDIRLLPDSSLQVGMDLVLPKELKINSNRMMTFTPVLTKDGNEAILPAVCVYGRKRQIINERKNRMPAEGSLVVRRDNRTEQVIDYTATVPYQPWMKDAEVILEKDLCGCGNLLEENSTQPVAQVSLPEPEVIIPAIAYCVPQVETVKRRTLEGSAFLDFPVNQTVIYPNYRKNPVELAKIDRTLDGFQPADILHISIHGYASPEGSYANNTRLAQGRSQALKQYILKKHRLNDSIFSVMSTPEDWEGFKRFATGSDLAEKDRILAIAESDRQPDAKEAELKKLGKAYLYISKEWFPALRHSDYRIEYTVRPFTPEEARIMVKQDPTQLSLREMYDAAVLCEKGSEEYNYIWETAVRLYPDDPVANLNAAAMELERGNLSAARNYMKKADMSTPEAQDNMKRIILLEKKQQ